MTPQDYEQYKRAEKEHLKKLKELRQAVRVLERQKALRSSLDDMSRSTADVLEQQRELVERLAEETAYEEARLEVALDASDAAASGVSRTEMEEMLRRERARALVDELRSSLEAPADVSREEDAARATAADPDPSDTKSTASPEVDSLEVNPTKERKDRPEKTIGRM